MYICADICGMTGIRRYTVSCAIALAACLCSCTGGRERGGDEEDEDSLLCLPPTVKTVEEMVEAADEPDEPEREEELAFNDFFFLFTHKKRFQAEHIKFPLEIEELDASERTMTSGAAFREYFSWPDSEEYTLLLTDVYQMSVFQSGEGLRRVSAEVIDLSTMRMRSYDFQFRDSIWQLQRVRNYEPQGGKGDFLRFYAQFATDTVFQGQHLARQIHFTAAVSVYDEEEDEEGEGLVEGILLPSQWPAFRPELPQGVITNFDFGQPLDEARRIMLLQCGTASSMMRTFTFHHAPLGWELYSFDD